VLETGGFKFGEREPIRLRKLLELLDRLIAVEGITQADITEAIAALAPAADRYIYFTSATEAALGAITAFGRAILDDPDASAARATVGAAAASHAHAIADVTGLQGALDAKLDDGQASAFGLSLIDDPDASAARTTLGLGTMATQNAASVAITGGSAAFTGTTSVTGSAAVSLTSTANTGNPRLILTEGSGPAGFYEIARLGAGGNPANGRGPVVGFYSPNGGVGLTALSGYFGLVQTATGVHAFTWKNASGTDIALLGTAGGLSVTGSVASSTWLKSGSYTVGTVPSAGAAGAGAQIYVSNEVGGGVTAFSDGAAWRRSTDRAIIS